MTTRLILLLLVCGWGVDALENGLGRTPPMGWLAWERYRCITDCELYPDECISESLFRNMADLMVSEGYAAVGYEYIIIDDCWLEYERDANGKLQADKKRFPSGMKHLADYIHSKGLKFGMYEDYGNYTCAGYPGIIDNLELDAKTFAEWDVDYIKIDGCYADPLNMEEGYAEFGRYLNETGRPMIYSCSWPVYQEENGIEPNFEALKKYCNLWRNYDDIDDSHNDVVKISDYFADNQDRIAQHAGPGHWNDPDMLIIGNYGQSIDQARYQMALWAILAAPLLMSNDLKAVGPEFKAVMQHKDVIAVNQDVFGIQGKRIRVERSIEIWTRPISPRLGDNYSYAIAFTSRRTDGAPYATSVTLKDIGLENQSGYMVTNLFDPSTPTFVLPTAVFRTRVNPTGVMFFKAVPVA